MHSRPSVAGIEESRRDRVCATVGIWLVVLSTIALLPGAADRWVLPKVAIAVIGCGIAAFSRRTGRISTPVAVGIGLGALVLLICALLGAAPVSQLLGRAPRYEGLVTLPSYAAALWTGARSVGPGAPVARRETVYAAIATVSVVVGIVSILESFGFRPVPSDLGRPGSLLGNASDQGIVGILCFAVLVVAALGRAGITPPPVFRWYPAVGAAFGVLTVVLSESRADLVALIVLGVVCMIVIGIGYRGHPGRRPMVAALGALIGIAVLLPLVLPAVRNRLFSGGSPLDVFGDDRGALWQETFRLIAGHPLAGVGPSGFLDALPAYTTADWFRTTGLGVTTDSPHSAVLQAAVAGGIPLMLFAIALAIVTVVGGVRFIRENPGGERTELVLGALLALLGGGMALLATFTAPGTTILIAFLAGIVVSRAPRQRSATTAEHLGTRVLRVAFPVWAAALVVTTLAELPLQAATTDAADGELSRALDSFAVARAMRPWDADITIIEAQSLAEAAGDGLSGAAPQALHWASLAHDQVPDSVSAAKSLAAAEQFDGRLSAATRTASALNRRAPNDPQTLARLGQLYAARHLYATAQPVLEKAVRLDPRDGASWKTLGLVYLKLGNTAGARHVKAVLARLAAGDQPND